MGESTKRSESSKSSRSKREESPQETKVMLGFGKNFPWKLLEKREFEYWCEPEKTPGIKVSKSMIVVSVQPLDLEKFDFGDWIYSINYVRLKSKQHYYNILRKELKKNAVYKLQFEVYRTIKTQAIENVRQSSLIPPAMEIQNGYKYLQGYLTLYPGSSLGINIKAYNYKVYVVSTDNGFKSLGIRTFIVGDAILTVEGQPQTTCNGVSRAIIQALGKKRFVSMVIERPETMFAASLVQEVILAPKEIGVDPKLPEDVLAICDAEIKRMTTEPKTVPKSIYDEHQDDAPQSEKKQVEIAFKSEEMFIGMDPINPALLQKVDRQAIEHHMLEQQQQQRKELEKQKAKGLKTELRRTSVVLRSRLKSIGSTLKVIKKK